jgi:Ca-activated chloride channel family protein
MSNLPTFSFLWPRMLWLLTLVPVLALAYIWHDRRRRGTAAHHPVLKIAGLAMQGGSGWRRHTPPLLILLALTALLAAIARPQAIMMLPSHIQTVILAMDTSGSMRAEDVKPNRIQAARQAAKVFLDAQPAGVSVGVVSVAGAAAVAQPPSRRKEDVAAAIDRLQPQRGTALGNGLIIALATSLPNAGIDVERFMEEGNGAQGKARKPPRPGSDGNGAGNEPLGAPPETRPPASDDSAAIVLLSDGENNTGPEAIEAAEVAAEHGVRIYTVGIGTPQGIVITVDGWSARVKLDEAVLKKVADVTGAEYFRAQDAETLKKVYRNLSARLAFDKQDMVEITALFAALGALLAACAGLLSLWWFGRVL